MQVAVIGSGRMGAGIIKTLARVYTDLLWVGRNPSKIEQKVAELGLGDRVRAVAHAEGLKADVIILTLWHRDTPAFVAEHGPALAGKIVVNIANPFTEDYTDFTIPWDTSAAEEFQRMAPEARVVGAFKNTFWAVFDQPSFPEGASDLLIAADDDAAKAIVIDLFRPLPFRVLDAGPLINNRTIERMTLLGRQVAVRYGWYPQTAWRVLGENARRAPEQLQLFLVITTRTAAFDPAFLPGHYTHLNTLRDQGRVTLYGPFADGGGGAYLLKAASLDEAQALVAQDPLIASGSSTVTVRPWKAG